MSISLVPRLDLTDCFQIAAVKIKNQIGKFRPGADIQESIQLGRSVPTADKMAIERRVEDAAPQESVVGFRVFR